ncbi:hypothetical protein AQI95_29210 [Streptomyces yokosukanensis]|uniref:Uncharacterized protein n=2 Tax=Streptomyces yokosukanensis TaxID=67386 RepID=A0A101NZH5_9ACTN|nr:hypothetical protein AQI95_29210 [Streptomyces yokosukanensis]
MLLHDVADRINTVADQIPLPDQIRPEPALGEILDDEVRHLARLLGYLAGESAFRHRAAARYPAQVTVSQRRVTLALAGAAEPAGAALAALGSAIHCLGVLADLTHQSPGPARHRATAAAHQQLVDHLAESRTRLAQSAKYLRHAADTRSAPSAPTPAPPTASPARIR